MRSPSRQCSSEAGRARAQLVWRGMARYLVTGGAGFIGSAVVDALVKRGDAVRVIDNFVTGKRSNLAPHWQAGNLQDPVELHESDLRDESAAAKACEGIDTIFHQAALPSVPRSVKDPRPSHEANVDGTFNLLEAARAAGVRGSCMRRRRARTATSRGFRAWRRWRRSRSRRMQCRSWRGSSTCRATGRCTGWRRCACATSTSSGRDRCRTRRTRA